MKNCLIAIGAAKYNMGSQMLLRGITQIIKENGAEYIAVSSADINEGESLNIPFADKYVPRQFKWSKYWLFLKFNAVINRFLPFLRIFWASIQYRPLIRQFKNYDTIILVAADNYDYDNRKNVLDVLADFAVRQKNNPAVVLYDFSISEKNITKHLKVTCAKVDILSARDSLSYDNLVKAGIDKNLYLIPDPAFIVSPSQTSLPRELEDKKFVGVNVSSLVTGKTDGKKGRAVLKAYERMIEKILSHEDLNILLIPHVMRGADLKVLKLLFEKFKDTKRVFLISDESLNGPQLKYIISKCEFFVGARTHATIAAYSSCVPTLVLGYSIKSLGIAKDLFGSYGDYVVNLDLLNDNADILAQKFDLLYSKHTEIKARLEQIMPRYMEDAKKIGKIIADFRK